MKGKLNVCFRFVLHCAALGGAESSLTLTMLCEAQGLSKCLFVVQPCGSDCTLYHVKTDAATELPYLHDGGIQ